MIEDRLIKKKSLELEKLCKRDDSWRDKTKNFVPTGIISTANQIRGIYFPHKICNDNDWLDQFLKDNITYKWQFLEFLDWFFENKKTDLVIREEMIKTGIVQVGSVAEGLEVYFIHLLKNCGKVDRDVKKLKFKGCNDLLKSKGIIGDDLFSGLEQLRERRDKIHIYLQVNGREQAYSESDYFKERMKLLELADILKSYSASLLSKKPLDH